MVGREEMHALVDSLPEEALECAHAYLKGIQTWPPKRHEPRPEVEKARRELEQKRDRFLKRSGSGSNVEVWSVDRNNKTHASCGSSEHNWETGEMTVKTFRVHYDFPMEITERFRMKDDDKTLEYDFHISGLGNEHGFVVQFKNKQS